MRLLADSLDSPRQIWMVCSKCYCFIWSDICRILSYSSSSCGLSKLNLEQVYILSTAVLWIVRSCSTTWASVICLLLTWAFRTSTWSETRTVTSSIRSSTRYFWAEKRYMMSSGPSSVSSCSSKNILKKARATEVSMLLLKSFQCLACTSSKIFGSKRSTISSPFYEVVGLPICFYWNSIEVFGVIVDVWAGVSRYLLLNKL